MKTDTITATVPDRAETAACPPERPSGSGHPDTASENTWSKALTDEEFSQALHRVLRGKDHRAD